MFAKANKGAFPEEELAAGISTTVVSEQAADAGLVSQHELLKDQHTVSMQGLSLSCHTFRIIRSRLHSAALL